MVVRLFAALALLLPAIAHAAPVAPASLRRHIAILASDDYQGRAPGTEGERKTIGYIAGQFRAAGLEPAGDGGGWYQPVGLIKRMPGGQRSRWAGARSSLDLGRSDLLLIGNRADERLRDARVVFAGHGAVMPEYRIDQLAGAPLDGAIVLILFDAPDVAAFPAFEERAKAVAARGAAAVIGIIADYLPWHAVDDIVSAGRTGLEIDPVAPIRGMISQAGADRLARAAGTDLASLLNSVPGPAFKAMPLALRGSLEVRTGIERTVSNNVVGRLRGTIGGQSVLFLGHWDHFGVCRPAGARDRICNGAIDNASGIAAMIEIARGLAAGPRPKRDILFLATTAEEVGLLGAEYFAARPPVPLDSIVAALNLDTVAIAGRGAKVSVLGRGHAPFPALIAASADEVGREIDADEDAESFLERQDAWALARHGVPSAMIGGAFSDMALLGRYIAGTYHQPDDELGPGTILTGAAEDSDLMIVLARKLADPAIYRPAAALARP